MKRRRPIGVGMARWRHPSLRTGWADFPHPASPRTGVRRFSPRLAERDNDGNRGLEPTDRGQTFPSVVAERRLNVQTRPWRSTVAPRQMTATLLFLRGLKSTATIMASLREASAELQLRAIVFGRSPEISWPDAQSH